MIIKMDKEMRIEYICGDIVTLVLLIIFAYELPLLFIMIGPIVGVVMILGRIAMHRTILLDEKGYSIKFLGLKKFYAWKDLKIVREEKTTNMNIQKLHTRGISICPKKVHKFRWMDPMIYCMFVHPFSYVFLEYREPNIIAPYMVDEKEIKEKFKEWNVNLILR